MREPTKEEMIEGIAKGVYEYCKLHNDTNTLAEGTSTGVLKYLKYKDLENCGTSASARNTIMQGVTNALSSFLKMDFGIARMNDAFKSIPVTNSTSINPPTQPVLDFATEIKELILFVSSGANAGGVFGLLCADCSDLSSDLVRNVGAQIQSICDKYSAEIIGVRYIKETDTCFYTVKHDGKEYEVKIM